MKITIVAGARPNFMKISPIIKAIHQRVSENATIDYRLVHTGQQEVALRQSKPLLSWYGLKRN